MFLIKNSIQKNKSTHEECTGVFLATFALTFGLQLIMPNMSGYVTEVVKYDFAQIVKKYPEISGIYKIDNIALIKDISPNLQGLAQIELNSDTTLSKDLINQLIYTAAEKYNLENQKIRLLEATSNDSFKYFLVYDPKNYLEQHPQDLKYNQWSYFDPRDVKGNVIINTSGYSVLPK